MGLGQGDPFGPTQLEAVDVEHHTPGVAQSFPAEGIHWIELRYWQEAHSPRYDNIEEVRAS